MATAADLFASHSQWTSPATAVFSESVTKTEDESRKLPETRKKIGPQDPVLVPHSREHRRAQWPQAPRLVLRATNRQTNRHVPPRQRVRRGRTSTWDQNLRDFCAPKKRCLNRLSEYSWHDSFRCALSKSGQKLSDKQQVWITNNNKC